MLLNIKPTVMVKMFFIISLISGMSLVCNGVACLSYVNTLEEIKDPLPEGIERVNPAVLIVPGFLLLIAGVLLLFACFRISGKLFPVLNTNPDEPATTIKVLEILDEKSSSDQKERKEIWIIHDNEVYLCRTESVKDKDHVILHHHSRQIDSQHIWEAIPEEEHYAQNARVINPYCVDEDEFASVDLS
jgi:hypothetical protein